MQEQWLAPGSLYFLLPQGLQIRHTKCVANNLKDVSILRLSSLILYFMMPRQQSRHRIWILLCEFGAAFNVRKEEGDSARRKACPAPKGGIEGLPTVIL